MVVRDLRPREGDEDERLILTAAHVVGDASAGATMAYVEPCSVPSVEAAHLCGELRRRVPLTNLSHIAVDAAVIKPHPGLEIDPAINGIVPRGTRDLLLETDSVEVDVMKCGANTGLTRGRLLPANVDHYMTDVDARYTCGWWAVGDDGGFGAEGDSGSVVLDERHMVVGMLVGLRLGGPQAGAGFVHGIRQILTALDIDIPSP
jgi:hypothetical protein